MPTTPDIKSDLKEDKYKIGIVGLHALPNSHGGYEQYFTYVLANDLFINFARTTSIIIYCKDDYEEKPKNINFAAINPTKGTAGVSYYIAAMDRAIKECDFIYCCGTGASIGLLRSTLGLRRRRARIATNVDGEEHKRKKYNFFQRIGILALHVLSMTLSNVIILDSHALLGRLPLTNLFKKKLVYIPYFFPEKLKQELREEQQDSAVNKFDLVVARLVPENNIELIIQAKLKSKDTTPLYIVGDTDNSYGQHLLNKYGNAVTFLGGIYDQEKLNLLRRRCRNYIHGHSVGGTNPSLIEALWFCQTIFSYDTVYNRETASDAARYFTSVSELQALISSTVKPTNISKSRISAYGEDDGVKVLLGCMSKSFHDTAAK